MSHNFTSTLQPKTHQPNILKSTERREGWINWVKRVDQLAIAWDRSCKIQSFEIFYWLVSYTCVWFGQNAGYWVFMLYRINMELLIWMFWLLNRHQFGRMNGDSFAQTQIGMILKTRLNGSLHHKTIFYGYRNFRLTRVTCSFPDQETNSSSKIITVSGNSILFRLWIELI
jgi:hypothetical protein